MKHATEEMPGCFRHPVYVAQAWRRTSSGVWTATKAYLLACNGWSSLIPYHMSHARDDAPRSPWYQVRWSRIGPCPFKLRTPCAESVVRQSHAADHRWARSKEIPHAHGDYRPFNNHDIPQWPRQSQPKLASLRHLEGQLRESRHHYADMSPNAAEETL